MVTSASFPVGRRQTAFSHSDRPLWLLLDRARSPSAETNFEGRDAPQERLIKDLGLAKPRTTQQLLVENRKEKLQPPNMSTLGDNRKAFSH